MYLLDPDRGELPHPKDINAAEARVRKIPGVSEVENLLHLPHAPAWMS
ncbi:MAG: BON domain-containing protein [Chloroflexota bacterium]|nr:BON domain-containing protein [Chloroflexota bacterium]